jgi:hypothetical protein
MVVQVHGDAVPEVDAGSPQERGVRQDHRVDDQGTGRVVGS